MASSRTVPRVGRPRVSQPARRARLRGSSVRRRSLVARRRPKIDAQEASRRRDVQLVGIALGVWVLLMLVMVQWA